jgi:hypothetical protein
MLPQINNNIRLHVRDIKDKRMTHVFVSEAEDKRYHEEKYTNTDEWERRDQMIWEGMEGNICVPGPQHIFTRCGGCVWGCFLATNKDKCCR